MKDKNQNELYCSNVFAYEREHNETPDDTKITLAKHFHVSTDYLLDLTGQTSACEAPRNCILLNKDFTFAVKTIRPFLARMMTAAYRTNPKAIITEIERDFQRLVDISEEENETKSLS